MVRLAFSEWPGHVTFPDLMPFPLSAVLPLWTLLIEQHTSDSLLRCLEDHGVDDFLYKASVFECERHLNAFRARINSISFPEEHESENEIKDQLSHIRLALNRLYRCVEENRNHERAYARLQHGSKEKHHHCDRDFFAELETEVLKLDKSVLRTMEWLSTTMSIKDSSESLRLTATTMKQTQSMALLTRLAFVYAPLTFTTGIFGMNLQQINESPLPLSYFFGYLIGILIVTAVLALGVRKLEKVAHIRNVTVKQLISSCTPVRIMRKTYRASIELARSAKGRSGTKEATEGSAHTDQKTLSKLEAGENL